MGAGDTAFDHRVHGGHIQLVEVGRAGAAVGSRPPDCRDDDSSRFEVGVVGVRDDTDGLVAQDEVVIPVGEPPVFAGEHLDIGAVDADPERPDQRLTRLGSRPRLFDAARGVLPAPECDGVHTTARARVDKRFIVNRVKILHTLTPRHG